MMKASKPQPAIHFVIDGKNAVMGRLASGVAKRLLKGEKITVINADKVVVTGNPKFNKRILLERRTRGSPQHGPFYPRSPEAMLWRAVRGMLPYKKSHGREALARLQVKAGDAGLKGEPVTRAVRSDFAYLGDLAKEIGWDGL